MIWGMIMKKTFKLVSLILCVTLILSVVSVGGFAAEKKDYVIVSPYEDVIWSGEGAWGAYKGTLHSHTTYSDGNLTLESMIKEYYEQDYDFVANADHGVTGVEWNRHPEQQLLYCYNLFNLKHLTDEEFEQITNGTYPLYDGTIRNKKMVCVTGANELNNLTVTKPHVNGYFLPEEAAFGYGGTENGYDEALSYIEKNGGLSHINHPGDWLYTNDNPDAVNNPDNVKFFGDLILKYDSCLGTEVFNEDNGVDGYDRILWDNLLMYTLPYGKNVIAFSNTDAHDHENIDTSFNIFMMEENDVDHIKETMQSGAFFCVTRKLRVTDIGPYEEIDAMNTDLPYPVFTSVEVDDHAVLATAKDCDYVQFIADGKIIKTVKNTDGTFFINLDEIEGAEDFDYIRVEAFGEGGICLTQALVIEDGSDKNEYQEQPKTELEKFIYIIKGSIIWGLLRELFGFTN